MRHNILVMLAGVMVALVLAGCVSAPERELSELDDKRSFMKSSHTPLPFDQPAVVASESAILLPD